MSSLGKCSLATESSQTESELIESGGGIVEING